MRPFRDSLIQGAAGGNPSARRIFTRFAALISFLEATIMKDKGELFLQRGVLDLLVKVARNYIALMSSIARRQ